LENIKLELKRENDRAILDCLENANYQNSNGCNNSYYGHGNYSDYRNEICECMVGKKHEIEAVETAIKQLERRIELLKSDSKPAQNEKK
jgi:hypothetical protein